MTPQSPDSRIRSARASRVVLAMVLVTAISGYFMGLRQVDRARGDSLDTLVRDWRRGTAEPESGADGWRIPGIVEYSRMGESGLKPNAAWRSSLAGLRTPSVSAVEGVRIPATDMQRQDAVVRRASRRAFDGAPPVVPHPVDAASSANCRVCHEAGLAVREVVAPRMSHPELGNCTQCHVPAVGGLAQVEVGGLEASREFGQNTFRGRASAGRGGRVWAGAPPTIPHGEWMRQNCSSCHGATGQIGLRTSHPERVLCTQCHVPESGLDVLGRVSRELAGPGAPGALNASR